MKFVRFLFFAFLFVCCLFTFPITALSEGGYQFVTKWGNDCPANCLLRSAKGIATDSSGNVYVTDYVGNAVRKYAPDGTIVNTWGSMGSGNGQFNTPSGIAIDSSGSVYVADSNNDRIQKFTSGGTFIMKWGSGGSGDGHFTNPSGIAVDASGNVYVVDSFNNRVQQFTSTGIFVTKWGSAGSGDGQLNVPLGIAVDFSGNVYVADTFNNRIQKFTSTGVFVTKWGGGGSGLNFPNGIAVDSSGNVYVAETGNNRILKFTTTGTYVAQWGFLGTGDGQFNKPYGVAADSLGNVYVTDTDNGRIQKFTSTGTFVAKWGSLIDGQLYYPYGIAADSSGNIYVADTYNHRIQKFTSSGAFVTKWGSYGPGNGQFSAPMCAAVDGSGNVYVADGYCRIQKFTSTGTFVTKWGSCGSGDGQFNYPYGIAVDTSGNVYVCEQGNHRIQKFSASGSFITKWGAKGSGDGQFQSPWGIAVDASGNVYVVDQANHRIQKFTSSGTFVAKWGSLGSGDGQFGSPDGIAVDASGNVYVVDSSYYRIQKFSSSGTFLTKWGSQGTGDGQFKAPYGVAVDASGNVYVADTYNNRIQKFAPPLYFPHIATSTPWQTEIGIINTGDQAVTGTLSGFSDKGQLIEAKDITLSSRGRRQITVANEFTNHTDIGYMIFVANSGTVQGYMKFYTGGKYRAAIPAVKEVNTDIYIPHIASNAQWWTGISLLNTTLATKELTITFNTGESRSYTLNANEHNSFDIAQEFFNNQPRPDIQSAVITHADGVIGLELFGNNGGSNRLDGVLLTGNTATTLYYPHVASNDQWWTGIAAYNPSDLACTIIITPYNARGYFLPPSAFSLEGRGKYVGTISELGLYPQTAWFRIDSTWPLTGLELFGTNDGNQLAAYSGVGGTGAKAGVFPKIEKNGGWTRISFVNTEGSAASVTMTAYKDDGTPIATQVLPVDSYAKVINLAEALFSQDISGATYIAYSSDRNVVGFQLNGSADGMMLDGLPALAGSN
jgi:tripartite motif-containing protein 71